MDELERHLILHIQRAPLEERPWLGFVRELRLALGGNLAAVSFRLPLSKGFDPLAISEGPAARPSLREMVRAFREIDPIPYFQLKPGRVYRYRDLETVQALDRDLFLEQFLEPAGLHELIIFRVASIPGSQMWVTITRPPDAPPFEEAKRALCERLAEHLSIALTTHAVLNAARIEIATYARAADTLAFGVISLDSKGEVLSIDEAATRTLRRSDLLSVKRGRLQAGESGRAFQALIDEVLLSGVQGGGRSVHLGGADGLDLLLLPRAMQADAGAKQPRVLVYISRHDERERDLAKHLGTLFGLSKTQARLAERMAAGRPLAEAAAEIGITEQTARSYSKEIYAKIGVTRQGELVQRILTSVAMLDAGSPGADA